MGEIAIEGHNVKVGRGGIREIDFLCNPTAHRWPGDTRSCGCAKQLATLDAWPPATGSTRPRATSSQLLTGFCARSAPAADGRRRADPHAAGRSRGARTPCAFLGFAAATPSPKLCSALRNVQRHYATLFENAPAAEAKHQALVFPPMPTIAKRSTSLLPGASGRRARPPRRCGRWLAGSTGPCAALSRADSSPILCRNCFRRSRASANPDAGLIAFDRFLASLQGGGRLLSLLRQNPELVALLDWCWAPRALADSSRIPDVGMPSSIQLFSARSGGGRYRRSLERSLAQAASMRLSRSHRIFAQEQCF